jgi:site-specific recombinase XerD
VRFKRTRARYGKTSRSYAFRHAFATWALEAGGDLFRLTRVMGTSVAMIDPTYGHLSRDHAVEMRDLLNRRPSLVDADES